MRMITKGTFFAAFLLSLLVPVRSMADPIEACPAAETCAPCGYTAANVDNIPSDAPGLNPVINYTATAEYMRCRGYFGGFYLGAAYGLADINYHFKIPGNSPYLLDSDSRSYFESAFQGGFNLVLSYFFLGIEGAYNYRSRNNPISYYDTVDYIDVTVGNPPNLIAEATSAPCKVRIDINSQHAWTADLLPGVVYSRIVAYLRLGVEEAQYNYQRRVCFPAIELNNDNADNFAVVTGSDFHNTAKKSTTGYRLGAGFGIAAGQHVSFHLNYIHTFGSELNLHHDVSAIAANVPVVTTSGGGPTLVTVALGELAANSKIEPQRDEITFGVKFRF